MDSHQRLQLFANSLKLFTSESADGVKALAALDALPEKLSFGSEGYIVLYDPADESTYTQVASVEGRPLRWEVSSQPYNVDLTPIQQRALRRYGFTVFADPSQNASQEWPRERMADLPQWMERVFRDVFGLPNTCTVALAGGV